MGMLERGNTDLALSRLTVFALGVTRPAFLIAFLLVCIAAVALSEATVKTEGVRLLNQAAILLVLVLLLAVALSGFLIPFHVPRVTIP